MIKRPDQRVAIFIDTQNMYHSAKHLYNARVNFGALVEAAVANRRIIRAVAYVAKSKTGEEQGFFEALMQSGIELKIKDVQEFASGQKKADWDVGMTVDAISLAQRVDAVILVTGDGDFVPLVEYLKGHGVLCEVVAFNESTNNRLREVCDSFLDVSENSEQFLINPHPRTRHTNSSSGVKTELIPEEVEDRTQEVLSAEPVQERGGHLDRSDRQRGGRRRPSGGSSRRSSSGRHIRVTY